MNEEYQYPMELLINRVRSFMLGESRVSNSEVSKHINRDHPHHSISLDNVKILDVEQKRFERGVREAIPIRMKNTTFNKDAGRYNLPPWPSMEQHLEEAGKEGGRSQDLQPGVEVSQHPELCHTTWQVSGKACIM